VRLSEDHGITDADVSDITGIALGNSSVNRPGFAGATLLAQIQAFADSRFQGGDLMELSIDDVRSFIKANKSRPSDLFGVEELTEDASVKGFVETRIRSATSGEYAHRKREEEAWDAKRKEMETRIAEQDAKIKEKDVALSKTRIPALLESAFKERKIDDRQRKFISSRIERFTPTAPEKIEPELAIHLDREIEEYRRVGEIFGVVPDKGNGGNGGDKGAEPADDAMTKPVVDRRLDPETNPFIPKF